MQPQPTTISKLRIFRWSMLSVMKTLEFMVKALRGGELVIPISRKLPLSKVGEAQAAAEEGGIGNVLLVA